MKVLIATGLYPPEIGGPATHIEILERELPAYGIDVVSAPFGVVRKYPKVLRHLLYSIQLFKKARGASLIYALDPVSVGLPASIVAWVLRKKFVLRIAGDYAWEQAVGRYGATQFLDEFVHETRKQPFMVRVLAHVERFVACRADCVVVPSEYLKRIVSVWGVMPEKIHVVYNAFAPMHITETREAIRTMFGYTGTVIISAGRLVPWKGFDTLIAIVSALRKEGKDIMCVIVGDGPEKERLVARVKECEAESYVRFVDRQPKETLATAIAGADIFVLNTAYEGFSHQLLEVMAVGTPIVTTNVGGNGELLTHEETGLLVAYDDSEALKQMIRKIMEDEMLRARLTQAARERAESFTLARMVHEVEEIFMQVVLTK